MVVARFLLLLAACVAVPVLASRLADEWLGVALAVAGFWVWGRLGPRPSPGFASGTLCLWGYAAILGTVIGCVTRALRH